MAGLAVLATIIKGVSLFKNLQDGDNVKKPAEDGVHNIALRLEGEAKKATVVDTGRLRASMTHRFLGMGAEVGTNVQYASFVEYGTKNMESRHMEGGRKMFGLGMLGYAVKVIKTWAAKEGDDIAKKIAESICRGD
uniref:Putative tail protein n=1 Tax=viral metagenome TaxID=1070528 RepID=A0A6H1ZNR6_9ZZZZ